MARNELRTKEKRNIDRAIPNLLDHEILWSTNRESSGLQTMQSVSKRFSLFRNH